MESLRMFVEECHRLLVLVPSNGYYIRIAPQPWNEHVQVKYSSLYIPLSPTLVVISRGISTLHILYL